MGRKRKNQEARRNFTLRLTDYEREQLEEKAAAQNMKVSDFLRHLILYGGVVDQSVHEDRQQLVRHIAAIGNNINQITRLANTNQYIYSSDVRKIWDLLRQILKLVEANTLMRKAEGE